MELTDRQRAIIEAISTIGRQDITNKQLADMLHIKYGTLIQIKTEAMHRNGYMSWDGFLSDFVREEMDC